MHPGEVIRARRQALGLSGTALAYLCGVRPETVSGWERKRRVPCQPLARRVEEILGMLPGTLEYSTHWKPGAPAAKVKEPARAPIWVTKLTPEVKQYLLNPSVPPGKKLSLLRRFRKVSALRLSKLVGVSNTYIRFVERGQRNLTRRDLVLKIDQALGANGYFAIGLGFLPEVDDPAFVIELFEKYRLVKEAP